MRKFLNQTFNYLTTSPVDDDFPEQQHKFQRLFAPLYERLPKIVCLCGSTRFQDAFQKANYDETMQGNIVLSVGCFQGEFGWGNAKPGVLDELHKRKIDLADEIFVLNVGGYIGESTQSEIDYATGHGKVIRYLEATQPLENLADEEK